MSIESDLKKDGITVVGEFVLYKQRESRNRSDWQGKIH